jgi:hypothetical protein
MAPVGPGVALADDPEGTKELTNRQKRLTALFILLALAGCVQGTTGQTGAPNTPPANYEGVHEHGGGDGGGGGGAM